MSEGETDGDRDPLPWAHRTDGTRLPFRGRHAPTPVRLYPHKTHADDCRLNFRTLMEGERAKKDLEIDPRNKAFFIRLPGESTKSAPQRTKNSVKRRSNAPSWATTFGGVQRVKKFLDQFADADEFINQLRIEYRNADGETDEVFWRDFCFNVNDEAALIRYYGRLRDLRIGMANTTKIAPIALIMTVEGGPLITSQGTKHWVRARPATKVHNLEGKERDVVVSVYSETRVSDLAIGDRIIVLGHAYAWEWSNRQVIEIRLDVDHSWQIDRF